MIRTRLGPTLVAALAILLIAALPASAQGGASSQFYESALERYYAGDFAGAVIDLKSALKEDTGNISARVLLGEIYLRLGDGGGAEKEFKRAREDGADDKLTLIPLAKAYLEQRKFDALFDEIRPGARGPALEAQVLVMRGRAHLERHALDEAKRAFEAAERLNPDDPAPPLGLAMVAVQRGALDRAEDFADVAIERDRENADAWYVKGEIYRARKDREAAVGFYDRAIEIDSRHVPARLSRAGVLIDLDRDDEAREDIAVVRGLIPDNPQAAYFLALLFARAGDLDKAQDVLQTAAQLVGARDPDELLNDAPTLLLAGVVNYAQKNYADAYVYLGRYVALVPHNPGARKLLGALHLRRGEARSAIEVLEPALRLTPRDPQLLTLLGTAYMRDKRYADATRTLEAAAALEPDRAEVRTDLALSRLALGEREAAIDDLESVLSLGTGNTQAAVVLGLLHLRDGDLAAAERVARHILEETPDNPFAHNLIGVTRLRSGDAAGARAAFEKAVAADPAYTPARLNLASLDLAEGKPEAAEKRYRALLDQNPGDVNTMIAFARALEGQGRTDEAIEWLQQVRKFDATARDPQLHLIELLLAAGRGESAREVARALDELYPTDLAVLEARGRAEVASGDTSAALQTFRRMVGLATGSAPKLHAIAVLQARAQDVSGALATLERAIRVDPEYLPAYAAMTDLETRMGRYDAALKRAERLRLVYPESPIGDVLTGDAMMRAGKLEAAIEAYTKAVAKKPTSPVVLRLYRARMASGERAAALSLLERWVAANPADEAARRALAGGYIRAGRFDAAIAAHEALLHARPDDAALLNNLAWLYEKVGDDRALAFARRAHALAPAEAATLDTLGWVLVRHGEVAKGLTHLREAHTRAPDEPEIRYHLAVALTELGRKKEARRQIEAALADADRLLDAADARALMAELEKP